MDHGLAALVAPPPFDPADAPEAVTVARGGLDLRLTFRDGAEAIVAAETLRLNCRCAWCTRARIEDRFPARFEAVAATDVKLIGGYAAHLSFSDGHDRGIYPWTYIRRLAAGDAAAPVPARAA